jgi:hypothetical protein
MTELSGGSARPAPGAEVDPAVPAPAGTFEARPVPEEASEHRGMVQFVGVLLGFIGVWHIVIGLVALTEPAYFRATDAGQPLLAGYEAWAAVQLVVGFLALVIGLGVIAGNRLATVGAVALAVVSAVVTLVFIRAAPFWGCLFLALDGLVIWAVTAQAPPPRPGR